MKVLIYFTFFSRRTPQLARCLDSEDCVSFITHTARIFYPSMLISHSSPIFDFFWCLKTQIWTTSSFSREITIFTHRHIAFRLKREKSWWRCSWKIFKLSALANINGKIWQTFFLNSAVCFSSQWVSWSIFLLRRMEHTFGYPEMWLNQLYDGGNICKESSFLFLLRARFVTYNGKNSPEYYEMVSALLLSDRI